MKIKFTGAKLNPQQNHMVTTIAGVYVKVRAGEVVECSEEDGYRLKATGNFDLVVPEPETKAEPAKPAHHKAALGKPLSKEAPESDALLGGTKEV